MKKISLIALIFVFLLNVIPVLANNSFHTTNEKAVYVLESLGVIGKIDLTAKTTRGEAVTALVKAYGEDEVAQNTSETTFSDVDSKLAGYVEVAKLNQIINGVENGIFAPDALVTYNQFSKMAVCMLGYKVKAEGLGGYPLGYVSVASSEGLLKGISATDFSAPISNGDMATIIYNSLEVKMIEKNVNKEDEYNYTDNTLLGSKLKVDKKTMRVTANERTSFDSAENYSKKDYVMLTEEGKLPLEYNVGKTDIKNQLGRIATFYFYFDEDIDENVILGYILDSNQSIIEIKAEDITAVSTQLVEYVVTKDENEYDKKLDIALGIRMIYNGRAVSQADYTINLLKPSSGKVVFISSNSSDNYDMAIVSDVKNAVVSSISKEENELYLTKNKHNLSTIKFDDLDQYDLYKDGIRIELSDIVKDNIVSIEMSKDNLIATINVSDEKITGKVEEINSDEKVEVLINGTSYEVSYDIVKPLELGEIADFYLNSVGQIFFAGMPTETLFKYAYIIDSNVDTTINKSFSMKILDQSGKIIVLKTDSKVKVDYDTIMPSDVPTIIGKYKLVYYRCDASGILKEIKTAIDYTNDISYIGFNEDDFSKDNLNNSMYYKNTTIPTLGGKYLLPAKTVVFNIPSDKTDEENYMVTGTSIFISDVYYSVEVYDSDYKRHINAVVNYGIDISRSSEASLPYTSNAFVVDSLTTVFENDEIVTKVTGYQGGVKTSLKPAKTNTNLEGLENEVLEDPDKVGSYRFSQLKKADMIQYKLNAKGEVDAFRVLYQDGDAMGISEKNGNTYQVNLLVAIAKVSYIDDTTLCITTNNNTGNSDTSNRVFALSTVNIYIYDKATSTIKLGKISDILSIDSAGSGASSIFLRAYRNVVGDIVILK